VREELEHLKVKKEAEQYECQEWCREERHR
jgi:hypothetical protein